MDVDASILDVSAELIGKTPVRSKPTPLSPRSVSQDVIKRLGIVTVKEGRVDAATLNSLNETDYNSGIVSLSEVTRKAINDTLREPLWSILKEKAKVIDKHKFLSSCVKSKTIPKGTTPNVPLKVKDAPEELKTVWNGILDECGTKLTEALVDFHEAELVQIEQRAAKVIQEAFMELIPQLIAKYANINLILEDVVREVKLDSEITIRRLHNKRKRTPKPEKSSKKQKVENMAPVPTKITTMKKIKPKELFAKNSKNLKEKSD